MGAEGIEVIGEEMVPNYPNPPESWVQHFKTLLATYQTSRLARTRSWTSTGAGDGI